MPKAMHRQMNPTARSTPAMTMSLTLPDEKCFALFQNPVNERVVNDMTSTVIDDISTVCGPDRPARAVLAKIATMLARTSAIINIRIQLFNINLTFF